jgi:hypothetical protein
MDTDNTDDDYTPADSDTAASEIDGEAIRATVAAFTRSLPWPRGGPAWAREHRAIAAEHRRVAAGHEEAAALIDATSGATNLDDVAHITGKGVTP